MKLLHLSDLHLGKKLNEFSLYEDQKYILQRIVQMICAKQPDCVLLAGDIYDKPVPPAEAVVLFDDFLNQLAELKVPVCIMSPKGKRCLSSAATMIRQSAWRSARS